MKNYNNIINIIMIFIIEIVVIITNSNYNSIINRQL